MDRGTNYAPGVCNIGDAEIRRRRQSGWFGLAIFAAALIGLGLGQAAPAWYLVLFLPAFAASAGFVQAANRFCFYFGFAALFNFGATGERRHVADAASRQDDRGKARRVLGQSALLAAIVTLAVFAIELILA